MTVVISPKHSSDDFPNGMEQKDKIKVYYARTMGWQLIPARETADKIKNSEFAVLHIVMSFFESIAKYREGYCEEGKSKEYFRKGFELIFPEVFADIPDLTTRKCYLDSLYSKARCGLYHSSMTDAGILISNDIPHVFDIGPVAIVMNPSKLVEAMIDYLDQYLEELQNDAKLREKFEKRFDFEITP